MSKRCLSFQIVEVLGLGKISPDTKKVDDACIQIEELAAIDSPLNFSIAWLFFSGSKRIITTIMAMVETRPPITDFLPFGTTQSNVCLTSHDYLASILRSKTVLIALLIKL